MKTPVLIGMKRKDTGCSIESEISATRRLKIWTSFDEACFGNSRPEALWHFQTLLCKTKCNVAYLLHVLRRTSFDLAALWGPYWPCWHERVRMIECSYDLNCNTRSMSGSYSWMYNPMSEILSDADNKHLCIEMLRLLTRFPEWDFKISTDSRTHLKYNQCYLLRECSVFDVDMPRVWL